VELRSPIWPHGTPFVGDVAERSREVTARDIDLFTEITGDRNPIHCDQAAAQASRFGEIVVQGGVTSAILNAVVAEDLPGPGTVFLHCDGSFKAPVRPGDTITGRVELLSVREDKPIAKVKTTVTRNMARWSSRASRSVTAWHCPEGHAHLRVDFHLVDRRRDGRVRGRFHHSPHYAWRRNGRRFLLLRHLHGCRRTCTVGVVEVTRAGAAVRLAGQGRLRGGVAGKWTVGVLFAVGAHALTVQACSNDDEGDATELGGAGGVSGGAVHQLALVNSSSDSQRVDVSNEIVQMVVTDSRAVPSKAPAGHGRHPVCGASGALKKTAPRGGKVRLSDLGRPCHGSSAASTCP
jgi:acyl dehydratase